MKNDELVHAKKEIARLKAENDQLKAGHFEELEKLKQEINALKDKLIVECTDKKRKRSSVVHNDNRHYQYHLSVRRRAKIDGRMHTFHHFQGLKHATFGEWAQAYRAVGSQGKELQGRGNRQHPHRRRQD